MSDRPNKIVKTSIAFAVLFAGLGFGLAKSGVVKFSPYDQSAVKKNLAPKLAQQQVSIGAPVFIRIFKESAELELWMKDVAGQSSGQSTAQSSGQWKLFQTYPICYYSGDLGPKLKEGDQQSPEGFYRVSKSQMNPNSTYHLSFNLGYPNKFDRANGRTGSYLMVHGNCVSIGCYAMTDEKIEEIYTLANSTFKNGQKTFQVHIFPFRMTDKNMQDHAGSKWFEFWQNLKQGYDYFEQNKQLPIITTVGKKYKISDK